MQDQQFDRHATLELIRLCKIPTLPDRFMHIQQVINDPKAGAADLARIIQSDQSTTAIVLKAANSARANPAGHPVGNLPQAIARLGDREVAHIAMTMALLSGFSLPLGFGNVRDFWTKAYATGVIAEHLAQQLESEADELHRDEIFIAGLLLDIGRVMIGLCVDLAYFEIPQLLAHGEAAVKAEVDRYGIDHAEAGMLILQSWHFPRHLVEVVGQHHCRDHPDALVRICRIADNAAHKLVPSGLSIDAAPRHLADIIPEMTEQWVAQFAMQGKEK